MDAENVYVLTGVEREELLILLEQAIASVSANLDLPHPDVPWVTGPEQMIRLVARRTRLRQLYAWLLDPAHQLGRPAFQPPPLPTPPPDPDLVAKIRAHLGPTPPEGSSQAASPHVWSDDDGRHAVCLRCGVRQFSMRPLNCPVTAP